MNKITHNLYKDYAEQPYISPKRDLVAWEKTPQAFHYGVIEKKQMVRLSEGILPGHIIMLWRVHFNNFTNESVIPLYFEYRYGVDSVECLQTLQDLAFIRVGSAEESLDLLTIPQLKEILDTFKLSSKGKKSILLSLILDNVPQNKLSTCFNLRKYIITPLGQTVLDRYPTIIKKHGEKG